MDLCKCRTVRKFYISLLFYVCTNPDVYIFTQSELRNEMKRLIYKIIYKTEEEKYAETSV